LFPIPGQGDLVNLLSSVIYFIAQAKYMGGKNMICISAKKSMTHAVRAKRVLAAAGIPCEIVNLDGNVTKKGCAFGVSFPCGMTEKVQSILHRYDLDYGEIIGK